MCTVPRRSEDRGRRAATAWHTEYVLASDYAWTCLWNVHGMIADEVNGKAGNLNHALREMYPRGAPVHPGEVVAVFDCDQARAALSDD